jgi:TATA-binding protein-associated factor
MLAAEALAEVLVQCVKRKPSPNEKLIKNLCALTCADVVETPKATPANAVSVIIDDVETAAAGKNIKHIRVPPMSASEERARLEGAELVLRSLSEKLGDLLLDRLPKLWDCLTEALGHSSAFIAEVSQPNGPLPVLTADSQALITNLQVDPCPDAFQWCG